MRLRDTRYLIRRSNSTNGILLTIKWSVIRSEAGYLVLQTGHSAVFNAMLMSDPRRRSSPAPAVVEPEFSMATHLWQYVWRHGSRTGDEYHCVHSIQLKVSGVISDKEPEDTVEMRGMDILDVMLLVLSPPRAPKLIFDIPSDSDVCNWTTGAASVGGGDSA